MIHLYWHTDPGPDELARVEQWQRRMPGEDVTLWTPADLAPLHRDIAKTISNVPAKDHIRHAANVSRWWLLAHHGGMWADMDVTPLRPIPAEWSAQPWCASLEGLPTPFMCGGPAQHVLWDRVLAEALHRPQGTSPAASGGRALARVIKRRDGLVLLPAAWFASRDARGAPLTTSLDERFTEHAWTTSRRRYEPYSHN
jgi:mannosyltransferase OCH1-like enzyme